MHGRHRPRPRHAASAGRPGQAALSAHLGLGPAPPPSSRSPQFTPFPPCLATVQVFDKHMPGPNQIASKLRQDVNVTQDDLLKVGAWHEAAEGRWGPASSIGS